MSQTNKRKGRLSLTKREGATEVRRKGKERLRFDEKGSSGSGSTKRKGATDFFEEALDGIHRAILNRLFPKHLRIHP